MVERGGPRFDPARGDSSFAFADCGVSISSCGNRVVSILVEIRFLSDFGRFLDRVSQIANAGRRRC